MVPFYLSKNSTALLGNKNRNREYFGVYRANYIDRGSIVYRAALFPNRFFPRVRRAHAARTEPVFLKSPPKTFLPPQQQKSLEITTPTLKLRSKTFPSSGEARPLLGVCLPGAKTQEFQRFGKSCGDSTPPRWSAARFSRGRLQ